MGKTGSAEAQGTNVTKNVTDGPSTASSNVTRTVPTETSSAEKASEKPAAKQPGFEGILAITVLSVMGYIKFVRKQ